MTHTRFTAAAAFAVLALATSSYTAQAEDPHAHHNHAHHDHHAHVSNVPASIMGDHTHSKGDWMISYRPMRMQMEGNRDGTSRLSDAQITAAGLRIVPDEMSMDMHMFSAMYAPTDRLTLMLMGSYQEKTMDLTTYAMMNPSVRLGGFTTTSKGLGDTTVTALYQFTPEQPYSLVGTLGVSLPTGSTKETDTVLTPMGTWIDVRLPYAMQLGSGTYDLKPALTYTQGQGDYSWGAQYKALVRMGRNNQGYTLGDKHTLSGWAGYHFTPLLGATFRITAEHEGKIDGADTMIAAPVQTADPETYGGKRIALGLGLNFKPFASASHAVGAELAMPVYQDLNGPQMERDYNLSLRYSYSF